MFTDLVRDIPTLTLDMEHGPCGLRRKLQSKILVKVDSSSLVCTHSASLKLMMKSSSVFSSEAQTLRHQLCHTTHKNIFLAILPLEETLTLTSFSEDQLRMSLRNTKSSLDWLLFHHSGPSDGTHHPTLGTLYQM
jgi:transcriptional antiterminator Rof (Rho-off)